MENFTVGVKVSLDKMSGILCSAFDPGYASTAYWAEVVEKVEPDTWTYEDKTRPDTNPGRHWRHEYPLSPAGALIVQVTEEGDEHSGKKFVLNLDSIAKGLQVMAEKYPKHFANLVDENDDGETADVFVQCALFGEIVYG